MKCANCAFFDQAGAQLASAIIDPQATPDTGVCTAEPPVAMPSAWFPVSVFPKVHASRSCGRFTPAGGSGPNGGEQKDPVVVPFGRSAA
ncbi:hypothetical protein [Sphingomonas montanisoli]|uniref:hypothetical protein n=1 Tax=Sphingomonas montanisoli TaxID=2606412 RepID=UPI0015E189B5|nr:hypothetical protein [Sphingomonas montanisoli]